MTHIIDPFNDQHAIVNGELWQKARLFIPGPDFDPEHPTVADLTGRGLETYIHFDFENTLGTEVGD